MRQYSLPIRVYYEDTDAGGVVYHSNYLKFFERARTEALREHSFELMDLYQEHGVHFVVRSANLEFLQPARLDQLLYVITTVESVRQASIMYDQRLVLKDEQHVTTLCIAKLKLACVNRDFKPYPLPRKLSMEMKK